MLEIEQVYCGLVVKQVWISAFAGTVEVKLSNMTLSKAYVPGAHINPCKRFDLLQSQPKIYGTL